MNLEARIDESHQPVSRLAETKMWHVCFPVRHRDFDILALLVRKQAAASPMHRRRPFAS